VNPPCPPGRHNHPAHESGAEPAVLHLVQPRNRAPVRGGHLVDFHFGVTPVLENELGGPLCGLRRHPDRLVRVKADLDSSLTRRPDGSQEERDPAGTEGRGCRHVALLDPDRLANPPEEGIHLRQGPLGHGIRDEAGHRVERLYPQVRHRPNHGQLVSHMPTHDVDRDPRGRGNENVAGRIQRPGKLSEDSNHMLRLHSQNHQSGLLDGRGIPSLDGMPFPRKIGQLLDAPSGQDDMVGRAEAGTHDPPRNRRAQIADSENGDGQGGTFDGLGCRHGNRPVRLGVANAPPQAHSSEHNWNKLEDKAMPSYLATGDRWVDPQEDPWGDRARLAGTPLSDLRILTTTRTDPTMTRNSPIGLAAVLLVLAVPSLHAAAVQAAPDSPDPFIIELLDRVEPDRLMANVERLASFGTRNTMSTTDHPDWGIGAAREWIHQEMAGYSDRLVVSFDVHAVEPAGRIQIPVDLRNVMAILPGRSERRVYITGHYDSLAGVADGVPEAPTDGAFDHYAPGANDDASGTSLLMELARILAQSDAEFDATLVFMAIAGEEQGLVGAGLHAERMVAEGIPIDAVLNNDIVGNSVGGNGIADSRTVRVFSEGPEDSPSRQLARYVRQTAARYLPGHEVRLIARADRFGRGGDHSAFNREGFTAVRLTESRENYQRQHNVFDTPDGVDPEYLARNTRVNLASAASLALAPPAPVVTPQMLGRGGGYDALLRWPAVSGAVGYRIYWRSAWGPDWEHSLLVGDVTQHRFTDISIDDYVFGVAAVGPGGHESLVSAWGR